MHCYKMQLESMNQTELLKGTLSTIILKLLESNGKLYGYEITQMVRNMSGEKILLKEGSLYPALHKLEADGLVRTEQVYVGKRVRKYYHLTTPGKSATQASVDELLDFLNTIHILITTKPLSAYEPAF